MAMIGAINACGRDPIGAGPGHHCSSNHTLAGLIRTSPRRRGTVCDQDGLLAKPHAPAVVERELKQHCSLPVARWRPVSLSLGLVPTEWWA